MLPDRTAGVHVRTFRGNFREVCLTLGRLQPKGRELRCRRRAHLPASVFHLIGVKTWSGVARLPFQWSTYDWTTTRDKGRGRIAAGIFEAEFEHNGDFPSGGPEPLAPSVSAQGGA